MLLVSYVDFHSHRDIEIYLNLSYIQLFLIFFGKLYWKITCKMAIMVKKAYLSADISTFNFIMCIPEMKNEQHKYDVTRKYINGNNYCLFFSAVLHSFDHPLDAVTESCRDYFQSTMWRHSAQLLKRGQTAGKLRVFWFTLLTANSTVSFDTTNYITTASLPFSLRKPSKIL